MTEPRINQAHYKKRLRAERRFKRYGQAALGTAICILIVIIGNLVFQGLPGFFQTQIRLPVNVKAQILELEPGDKPDDAPSAAYRSVINHSVKAAFPNVTAPAEQKQLLALFSSSNGLSLKRVIGTDASQLGKTRDEWLLTSSFADLYYKGTISAATPEADRVLTDQQLLWLDSLKKGGVTRTHLNQNLFTQGDSRTPEEAGYLGAIIGSLLTVLVCLGIVFPIGVATAVYLEEFAHKNRWVDLVEVNINNLAAVPSIVFGLLGLAVYINLFGIPRSSPLVAGMTLAMMVLPVIIITTRVAIGSVPSAIRDAARGLGATNIQVVCHHVLPLAMPGIMTGTILGVARAIGETAPLIMIGMVAFVADIPDSFLSPATVMPVQIYLWASSPEAGFAEKTAAGILILLVILLALNALAIYLRKRFEVRW